MFNFWSKKKQPIDKINYDQAVILEIDFAGLEDFGTKKQQEMIRNLEESFKTVLTPPEGLDGDEFGEGSATIYLYGPNADKIYSAIIPCLEKADFDHIDVTLQYGPPDDPNTQDSKFTF